MRVRAGEDPAQAVVDPGHRVDRLGRRLRGSEEIRVGTEEIGLGEIADLEQRTDGRQRAPITTRTRTLQGDDGDVLAMTDLVQIDQ